MDSLTCGICLDRLSVPVSTPCGHLCCESCLTSYIETSADAMTASCPTCRTPFSIAIPDIRFVPKKYHNLIVPSIRRVFISTDTNADQASPDSRRALRAQVTSLTERVNSLVHEKGLLMDRCESAIRARDAHAQGERDRRLEKERLDRELHELRKKYDYVKGKYKALKASQENAAPLQPQLSRSMGLKRKSHQAALDALMNVASSSMDPFSPVQVEDDDETDDLPERPILRIPKRPRLLGSPFDLSKRIETRMGRKSRLLLDEDEEGDSMFLRESDLSSSVGPQRSGLPAGDIFSPEHRSVRGGRGSIMYVGEGRLSHAAWLPLSPEEE